MGFGAAALALTAVQGVSQIGQGYAQKAEANYNATLLEGKANMIDVQKDIEFGQYQRLKGKTVSKSINTIAGAGLQPTGSAMAVMLDTQTQINIDQAIGQFNLQQEKNYTMAQANQVRRQGKAAVTAGYTNAFTGMLTGVSNYAMYKGMGKITSAGTVKDTTFDSYQPLKGSVPNRYSQYYSS